MFNLFGKPDYKLPEPQPLWKAGPETEKRSKEPKENFRVGVTQDGLTTLSLMADSSTMTLTLNQAGCEQLIRMLRATYTSEKENENADA